MMNRLTLVLIGLLTLVFSTSAYTDCPEAGEFELPVITAMDAEVFATDMVSTWPTPIPGPKAVKDILGIADDYGQIGMNSMSIRSLFQRATLPIPVPAPQDKRTVMPLPPPWILREQAVRLQDQTLGLVEGLDGKILHAFDRGTLTEGNLMDLMDFQWDLHDQISTLPIPIPGEEDE